MKLSRQAILNYARPQRIPWYRRIKRFFIYAWSWLLVKLGKRVWAKIVYNRPRYLPCGFDQSPMKRTAKTPNGAFYRCRKCKKEYFFEGKGQRLVPVIPKKKGAK